MPGTRKRRARQKSDADKIHAIQSGVAREIEHHGEEKAGASPKHLRVGFDVALANLGALAVLLVEKGVISKAEYDAAVSESLAQEVETREARLSKLLGMRITLK